MTKTFKFWGASDDLAYWSDGKNDDEIGAFEKGTNFLLKSAVAEQRLRVTVLYAPGDGGTWMVGVSQVDEDDAVPPWPLRMAREHDYSLRLEIDCPDDTTLTVENAAD